MNRCRMRNGAADRRRSLRQAAALFIVIGMVIGLTGCGAGVSRRIFRESAVAESPVKFFRTLDAAAAEAGARNAAHFPVPGFPYLRTNRFLASLKDRVRGDLQTSEWIEAMRQLDLKDRRTEIETLPDSAVRSLAARFTGMASRTDVLKALEAFSEDLMEQHRAQPDYIAAVKAAVVIPEEYSTAMRVFGLYPVAALPVAALTVKAYNEFSAWHETPESALPVRGKLMAYRPPRLADFSLHEVRGILDQSVNSLGMYDFSPAELETLLAVYAPVIVMDVADAYDRFGRVIWDDGRVTIDIYTPTVYYYFTHAYYKNAPILQSNYVFWFTKRNGPNTPWIEKGDIDGLTVRISIDGAGLPVMVDIMNNCGCYHQFIPSKQKIAAVREKALAIDPFVPTWMPEDFPVKRLGVRLNSGWHQVQRITASNAPADARKYRLRPYDALEALPYPGGAYRSMFNEKGIAHNSERIEPYLLFSMGVPKVGYMRQRGHHATKLVGREYFDDPFIFEKNFVFAGE